MLYKEWLKKNEEDAKKVTEFVSYTDDIMLPNGLPNVEKIMDMHIMMCMHNPDGTISMTVC